MADVAKAATPAEGATAPSIVKKAAAAPAAADANGTEHTLLPKVQFIMVFISMALSCFIAGLDGTIVVTAMPVIAREFNALNTISWVIQSFMLTQTAGMPLWGRFCDIFGRRNCLLFSVGMFVVWSLACALSTDIVMLVVFRALQGVGGGGIMSCVMIVLADLTPPSSRAVWVAPLASMFALSSVCGPLLGGFLTDGPGWRYAFWINVPIGVPCMIIQWWFIPKTLGQQHLKAAGGDAAALTDGSLKDSTSDAAFAPTSVSTSGVFVESNPMKSADGVDSKAAASAKPAAHVHETITIDYWGSLTIIICILCLCLALVWGGSEYEWGNWRIITLLTVAFAFLFLFLFVESRPDIAKHPIMPLSLFKIWNFSVSSWVVFFTGATMAAGYVYLPLFFQYALLQSASESGISMIPMMLGLPVGAIFTGIFVTKSGKYVMYPIIGCAAAIVANYLYMTMRPDTPSHQLVGFLILGGLAAGPNVQVPLLAAQNAVPMADVAAATSSIQFFQSVSGLLAVAICQTILNNGLKADFAPIMTDLSDYLTSLGLSASSMGDSSTFNVKSLDNPTFHPFYVRFVDAYAQNTTGVFVLGIACAAIGLAGALLLKEIPLRDGLSADAVHVEGLPLEAGLGPVGDANAKESSSEVDVEAPVKAATTDPEAAAPVSPSQVKTEA